jgi:hypothetical protein
MYEKALDQTGGESSSEAGWPPKGGVGAPPAEPIRGELVDPASTAFEDE